MPKITRPIRLSGDSNTLIDNIHVFTNNFCKPHLAEILVTPVSDYLTQFCIINWRKGRPINNFPKCIEVENINPLFINNFKHAILKSNIYEKLAKNPDFDPNQNYEIFLSALTEAKTNHISKKTQRFCLYKYKHSRETGMTSELLKLVVRKKKLYREWK